jgi:hypothetical protein
MTDVPDDLTSVGRHRGNEPPTETGQEVRSPEGPDPETTPADPSPALFQVLRASDPNLVQIRVHSPRAEVPAPEEEVDEIGQYRTVDGLRDALTEAEIDSDWAVFVDAEANRVLTDANVTPDHAWIGRPRFETITFFADEDAAAEYTRGLDASSPSD